MARSIRLVKKTVPASSSTFKTLVKGSDLPAGKQHTFILIFSDFLGCGEFFSPIDSLFFKMQMQNKMYFGATQITFRARVATLFGVSK